MYGACCCIGYADGINEFVMIDYDSDTESIICNFVNSQDNYTKTCLIEYGGGDVCYNQNHTSNGESNTNIVIVKLTKLAMTKYCYSIKANNGKYTVIAKGSFYAGTTNSYASVPCDDVTNNFIGCDPLLLSDRSLSNASCDAPYITLGFIGGIIICYETNAVGSTALAYCYNCGFNSVKDSSIWTCLQDGNWNGSIPICNCKFCVFIHTHSKCKFTRSQHKRRK